MHLNPDYIESVVMYTTFFCHSVKKQLPLTPSSETKLLCIIHCLFLVYLHWKLLLFLVSQYYLHHNKKCRSIRGPKVSFWSSPINERPPALVSYQKASLLNLMIKQTSIYLHFWQSLTNICYLIINFFIVIDKLYIALLRYQNNSVQIFKRLLSF